jgi:uncharacterized protein YbjQ (UPF0145 family)
VNEFLMVKEAGFDPLGMVVGSSIYHIGYQVGNWNQNMELQVLSQAMYAARELAMARMEAEADALQADGIVGVRLSVGFYEWGENLAEFIAVGTAVRSRDQPGTLRTVSNKPFTSDLSGQDFWTLIQAGYVPLGLVMGTCVYHVAHMSLRGWFNTVGQNAEMPNFTQATYEARELAVDRMQYEAMQLRSDGIVGTQIQERPYYWGAHVIEFFAIGNAVRSLRPDHEIAKPQLTLPLS